MEALIIAFAAPVFFVLIALEMALASRRGHRGSYSFPDTVSNISCGIGQQLVQLLVHAPLLGAYLLVFEAGAVYEMPSTLWSWLVLLLLVDLAYYWFHRASHRINVLWAAHVVHHQSQHYNLSVALRQSWLEGIFALPFFLPLALLGFPGEMFVAAKMIQTLYQFWIHTREISKLGPFESVLTTPSHHRVHHGINPEYIDKNYGGMLIIWDRLFGSFAAEKQEPAYGTVKPLNSWNPVWANVSYFAEMLSLARAAKRNLDRLRVGFMPPEWRPGSLGGAVAVPPVAPNRVRYQTTSPSLLRSYIGANFLLVTALTVGVLATSMQLSPQELAICCGLTFVSLASWAALGERKSWGPVLELVRLAGSVVALAWLTRDSNLQVPAVICSAVLASLLALWLQRGLQRSCRQVSLEA
ncbi:MAG: sterol desaturase family protein [Proteobacteria bacterium]|nr:sterol desaturase family protein [Pseudomonadota bacterium]